MNKSRSLFLTGVTGTLGKELIREILATTDDKLYILARRKNKHSHEDRVRKILAPVGLEGHLGTRVFVLEGDVTLPGLGLTDEDRKGLRLEITEFYHIAALTALNGSEEDCFQINVKGTERALELAGDLLKNGKLERFYYYSTAYVAGSRQTYCSKEDELPEKPAHANFYESSKYAAEKKVREAMRNGLPAVIFRPSIVVGDSRTGEVSEFNVIYPFMKMFAHGMLSKLPTRPENAFNIIPIDFVVKASLAIARQKDALGKTFHLVTEEPPPIRLLLELRDREYPLVPPIEIVDPCHFKRENLQPAEQFVYDVMQPYLGYLNGELTFDTANTRRALKGTGIDFPKTDYDFLSTLVRYAVSSGYLIVH